MLLLAVTCEACTIFQFQNDGFASNALYLLRAIPIFLRQNGAGFPCMHAMSCAASSPCSTAHNQSAFHIREGHSNCTCLLVEA